MTTRPPQIRDTHLARRVYLYVRQSSEEQREHNVGSGQVQFNLVDLIESWGIPRASVDVIDDRGESAASPERRPGFERMLATMPARTHGMVVVVEIARLARNLLDFARFAEVARRHDVLLAVGTQIIDFRNPDSEFVSLVLSFSEVRSNRARADHGRRSRLEKAKKGIATTRPPTGYLPVIAGEQKREPTGAWKKDDDPRIQYVVGLVFDKFWEIRSVSGVVRFFRKNNITVPRRSPTGQIHWLAVTARHIWLMLRNECFAGTLVYGKSVSDESREPNPKGHARRMPRPASEYVRIEDHHESYVSLERWKLIQSTITANRKAGPAAGRGPALLQGRIRCDIHGVTFRTFYPYRGRSADGAPVRLARYRCQTREEETKGCLSVAAQILDPVIERELLRSLTPPSTDLIRETVRASRREHDALVQVRKEELRRAEQLVTDRERAWEEVDANTQAALKRRFRDRLAEASAALEDLKTAHLLSPLVPPMEMNDAELAELRSLLSDLPALWRHPCVTSDQRKALFRRVIRVVHAVPRPESCSLDLEWISGARTPVEFINHRGVEAELKCAHGDGLEPVQIVERFSQRGIVKQRGALSGTPYTERDVRRLTLRLRLQQPFDQGAYVYMRARYLEGASNQAIADELNARGVRHFLGKWTSMRVAVAVQRLRRGRVPGIEPLPPLCSFDKPVRTLYAAGLWPREIAARLKDDGFVTCQRRAITVAGVYRILKRLGLRCPSTVQHERLVELLKEWAPTLSIREITRRVNALGLRTILGHPWTEKVIKTKLAKLNTTSRAPGRIETGFQTDPGQTVPAGGAGGPEGPNGRVAGQVSTAAPNQSLPVSSRRGSRARQNEHGLTPRKEPDNEKK